MKIGLALSFLVLFSFVGLAQESLELEARCIQPIEVELSVPSIGLPRIASQTDPFKIGEPSFAERSEIHDRYYCPPQFTSRVDGGDVYDREFIRNMARR